MKPLRILLITPYFYPSNYGGAPVVYKTIIDKSSHRFSVFTDVKIGNEKECFDFDKQMTFPVYRAQSMVFTINSVDSFPITVVRLIKHIVTHTFSLIRTIITGKIDILICGNVFESGWLLILVKVAFRNMKLVSYVHGEEITTEITGGAWSQFLRWGCRKVLSMSQLIITVSNYSKNIVVNNKIDADKVKVITNGVDLKKYFLANKKPVMINRYRLNGKKVILSLARLVPKKGFDKVIEALPAIISKMPDTVYLVGGTGPDRDRLEELARHFNVTGHVIFADFISDTDINDFMNLADVFVMPNRSINGDTEGFGLVFLEANACGVPVIGGLDGGTADAIIDGVTGFRVNGTDINAIANKIIFLLNNPDERKQMGETGRKWVLENQGWDKKVQQFDRLVEALGHL